jgi:hypothetical protein
MNDAVTVVAFLSTLALGLTGIICGYRLMIRQCHSPGEGTGPGGAFPANGALPGGLGNGPKPGARGPRCRHKGGDQITEIEAGRG